MDKWITVTEYNWVLWVGGFFALAELFRWSYTLKDWFFKTLGWKTKTMQEKENWNQRITNVEDAIKEIKHNSEVNVRLFLEHEKSVIGKIDNIEDAIVGELVKLNDKIDKQRDEMDDANRANVRTDCAMLRDRIASGMRHFSKNKDKDGNVHISFSDYENMEALFREYFSKGGNGAFKKLYDTEFQKFIIDE